MSPSRIPTPSAKGGPPSDTGADLIPTSWWLSAIIDVLEEHLYLGVLDAEGGYRELFAGPGLDRLIGGRMPSGLSATDVWRAAIHPEDLPAYHACEAEVLEGRTSEVEYRVRGIDGVTRWIRAHVHPQTLGEGSVRFAGILSDVSEQHRASDALHASLRELGALNGELARAHREAERLAGIDALTGVANRRRFSDVLASTLHDAQSRCGIVILDVDHFKRINDAFGHRAGDAVLVEIAERIKRSAPRGALVARWGGEEFIVLLPRCATGRGLRRAAERIRTAIRAEPTSGVGDRAVGVTVSCGGALAIACDPDATVDAADAALYRAKQSGRDRTVLAEDRVTVPASGDLELVRYAHTLARTLSIREGVTEHHAAQVGDLAAKLAEDMGLPATTVLRCRLAGLLHDIGKIAIPDRLLVKPGPLEPQEWKCMRSHAALGADLVESTPGLEDTSPAIRYHHERWDGTGYPDGLTGEQIPLEARIVAAADMWSSMTNHRVYKPSRAHAAALRELDRAAGSQLDPRIAAALHLSLRREAPLVRAA